MITKYRALFGRIQVVEVESETAKCIVLNGRRSAKMSDWDSYFDTKEEAKAWLISSQEKKITAAEKQIAYAQKVLEQLRADLSQ